MQEVGILVYLYGVPITPVNVALLPGSLRHTVTSSYLSSYPLSPYETRHYYNYFAFDVTALDRFRKDHSVVVTELPIPFYLPVMFTSLPIGNGIFSWATNVNHAVLLEDPLVLPPHAVSLRGPGYLRGAPTASSSTAGTFPTHGHVDFEFYHRSRVGPFSSGAVTTMTTPPGWQPVDAAYVNVTVYGIGRAPVLSASSPFFLRYPSPSCWDLAFVIGLTTESRGDVFRRMFFTPEEAPAIPVPPMQSNTSYQLLFWSKSSFLPYYIPNYYMNTRTAFLAQLKDAAKATFTDFPTIVLYRPRWYYNHSREAVISFGYIYGLEPFYWSSDIATALVFAGYRDTEAVSVTGICQEPQNDRVAYASATNNSVFAYPHDSTYHRGAFVLGDVRADPWKTNIHERLLRNHADFEVCASGTHPYIYPSQTSIVGSGSVWSTAIELRAAAIHHGSIFSPASYTLLPRGMTTSTQQQQQQPPPDGGAPSPPSTGDNNVFVSASGLTYRPLGDAIMSEALDPVSSLLQAVVVNRDEAAQNGSTTVVTADASSVVAVPPQRRFPCLVRCYFSADVYDATTLKPPQRPVLSPGVVIPGSTHFGITSGTLEWDKPDINQNYASVSYIPRLFTVHGSEPERAMWLASSLGQWDAPMCQSVSAVMYDSGYIGWLSSANAALGDSRTDLSRYVWSSAEFDAHRRWNPVSVPICYVTTLKSWRFFDTPFVRHRGFRQYPPRYLGGNLYYNVAGTTAQSAWLKRSYFVDAKTHKFLKPGFRTERQKTETTNTMQLLISVVPYQMHDPNFLYSTGPGYYYSSAYGCGDPYFGLETPIDAAITLRGVSNYSSSVFLSSPPPLQPLGVTAANDANDEVNLLPASRADPTFAEVVTLLGNSAGSEDVIAEGSGSAANGEAGGGGDHHGGDEALRADDGGAGDVAVVVAIQVTRVDRDDSRTTAL